MMRLAGNGWSVLTVVVGVALLAGCATAPGYRVEDRRIVLDSPFVLEIGSTEYAKTFGDLLRSYAHANYDPETKTTTTNFYHSAEAWLAKPYFGFERVWLSFEGEEKALGRCGVLPSGGFDRYKLKFSECKDMVRKIVADVEQRAGIKMWCRDEEDESTIKAKVEKDSKRQGVGSCFASSFSSFTGEKVVNGVPITYSVCGMYSNKGGCGVHFDIAKSWRYQGTSFKPGDKIPVHTNKMSLSSGSLTGPTGEQKQAHEEAKKLRETIKRLFDVDLDKPEEKAELMSAAVLTNVEKDVKREWTPLAKPFAGMTERKVNASVSFFAIPFGVFALRCPYDGDVSESELKDQAKRALEALEREYGAKIPELDTKEGTEMLVKRYGDGVPVFGDTKALLGLDKRSVFAGKVGDLAVDISYAAPRYAKNGDKYEIASKGAVVMNFVQSPFITKGKQKK